MITQPFVEFGEHRGSSKLIIKIIDPGQWIFVLYCCLVNGPIVLDQSVSSILLLNKERRRSPSRGTRADETLLQRLVNFLLKFKEFMWRHLVGALSNWSGTRFQVDD